MKLNAKSAGEFLQRPDRAHSGVLIYGPDGGLVRERMRAVLGKLVPDTADPFAIQEISEENWKEDATCIYDAMASISLLGGRRVILLRDAPDKAAAALAPAAEAGGVNYLLVTAGDLGPRSPLRVLFEQEVKFASLPCYKDEAADLGAVIRQRLEREGIRLAPGVMDYLTQQLGNDRGITSSELDKIVLYLGDEKTLSLEAAEQLVGQQRDLNLDLIALAAADGNPALLDAQLTLAWREGAQAIALLRATQRHFQRLYQLRAEMEGGKTAEQAVSALRPPVFFRHIPTVTRQAKHWSRPALARALTLLNDAESDCKGGGAPPPSLTGMLLQRVASAGRKRQ